MLNRIYHIHGTLLTAFFCLPVLKFDPFIDYNYRFAIAFLHVMLYRNENNRFILLYPFVWFGLVCIMTIIIICNLFTLLA